MADLEGRVEAEDWTKVNQCYHRATSSTARPAGDSQCVADKEEQSQIEEKSRTLVEDNMGKVEAAEMHREEQASREFACSKTEHAAQQRSFEDCKEEGRPLGPRHEKKEQFAEQKEAKGAEQKKGNAKGKKRHRTELDYTGIKLLRKDGMISIEPYVYTHSTYAKGRWIGQEIIDVYSREFLGRDRAYYEECMKDERIQVNGAKVSPNYIILDNDFLSHKTTCKENPVLDQPIQVVSDTDDILVVSKPSSIPIHACGTYRYLTLISLLKMQGREHLMLPLHRLDRLTSGLVLLAKTRKVATHITEMFVQKKIQKTYLCRVKGDFRKCNADKWGVETTDQDVTVSGYLRCVDHTVGKHVMDEKESEESKHSKTKFVFEEYLNVEDESIVVAYPATGRTHQIRVHLQHCGFPIANDPNYGPNPTKAGVRENPDAERRDEAPTDFCSMIYLHAWRYQSGEFHYESERPSWVPQKRD